MAPVAPKSISCRPVSIPEGEILHRIHSDTYGPVAFNPGVGDNRFSPINNASGVSIPTLYTGSTFECAVFETLLHDVSPSATVKTIYASKLKGLRYSTIEVTSLIIVGSFYSKDLAKCGCSRTDLIDTPRSEYPNTRPWAEAAHAGTANIQGLIWMSNRSDTERSAVLFGDRGAGLNLSEVSSVAMTKRGDLIDRIVDLAAQSGIVVMP